MVRDSMSYLSVTWEYVLLNSVLVGVSGAPEIDNQIHPSKWMVAGTFISDQDNLVSI